MPIPPKNGYDQTGSGIVNRFGQSAIKVIEKFGGEVTRDENQTEKPVIGVGLSDTFVGGTGRLTSQILPQMKKFRFSVDLGFLAP